MHLPEPIQANVHDESFAGVTYHIRGELVPELQIEVGARFPIPPLESESFLLENSGSSAAIPARVGTAATSAPLRSTMCAPQRFPF